MSNPSCYDETVISTRPKTPTVFSNNHVLDLYNLAHSDEVANMKHVQDITNALLPYIKRVIADPSAYSEAKNWSEFYYVVHQHETGELVFKLMDADSSMCFSLWMGIYH